MRNDKKQKIVQESVLCDFVHLKEWIEKKSKYFFLIACVFL